MKIGGLVKASLVDYPGLVAAVVFTQGCNLRCRYCHNPLLLDPARTDGLIPDAEVLAFLRRRAGLLDGVVISGGEPTLQEDLGDFLAAVRAMGCYRIKLDTNGTNPDMLALLLEKGLVDFVAMDVKAPPALYASIAGGYVDISCLERSMALIKSSGVAHVFRTTLDSSLGERETGQIKEWIGSGERLVLQRMRPVEGRRG